MQTERLARDQIRAPLNTMMNFPVCLAPMVGLSHVALRELVRFYTPEGVKTIWPTEMLNSRKLPQQNVGGTPETFKMSGELGLVPQILGNEERFIADSAKKLEAWGAEGIDINMGCPVKKALSHNYGVALMGDATYAAEVVGMTVRNTRLPVSVKLRSGHSEDLSYLLKFIEGLIGAGCQWITLHPRLASEGRRGNAKWETIAWVRERIGIPVIGNGDVQTCEDVFEMLSQTGCDAVMVGRALAARPWLMWQVGEKLGMPAPVFGEQSPFLSTEAPLVPAGSRRAPITPEDEGQEFLRAMQLYLHLIAKYFDESQGLRKFRFWLRMTSPWIDFGTYIMGQVSGAPTIADTFKVVERLQSLEVKMSPRTELRI
ncbi:MAG: tRNA-dihydrouridine synthase family protein [Bdellovibrionales bacterium]|nr:tRNA-dihydrouridine synthase family protein [Bdellovibrionales bacterium]